MERRVEWTGFVELVVVFIFGWAAWLSIPRPPQLDWERLLKVAISVGVWADLESEQAEKGALSEIEAEWRQVLRTAVPYHPAGRDWRKKLSDPAAYTPPIPAISGERGLLESLSALETMHERWERLFGTRAHELDPAVADALGDPRELGDAYDPRRLFGPEADWAAVAAWSEPLRAGLTRRLQRVVLMEIGLSSHVSPSAELPDVRRYVCASVADGPVEGWVQICESPSDRLVVVVHGAQLKDWLEQMAQSPALVDRVLAVVVAEGVPARSAAERDAIEAILCSEALLPELQRRTPIAVVDNIDIEIEADQRWSTGMAPIELPDWQASRLGVQWVDLGPLPVQNVPSRALSRAIAVLVGFLLDS